MSEISDVVSVSITSETAKVARQGFGLPLILGYTAAWVGELVREYASLIEVGLDFVTTSPEYIAAQKLFGQTPRPPKCLIGKGSNKPTQRFAVTPVVLSNYTYKMKVGSTEVSFLSDGTATATEIIAGLKAAIDGLSLAVTVSDQTTYMRVVANVAGAFFSLSSADANLRIKQDHADPGVIADLQAIAVIRNDWYAVATLFNSKAVTDLVAAWAEGVAKLYGCDIQDGDVPNTTISGTDDAAEANAGFSYNHTISAFSKATSDFLAIGWMGRLLPTDPGSETWKFKNISGVEVGSYTSTQRTNMRAKKCNFYEVTGTAGQTEEGYAASGQYIDFTRWLDYAKARIGERVFGFLSAVDKVPFNDIGIEAVASKVRGFLQSEEKRGAINPGWTVTVPMLSEVDPIDKAARVLRDVAFSCVYSSAIHKVLVNGVVTV